MLANLEDDLARTIALYRNRFGFLSENGQAAPAFTLPDVIRHFLFTRAEAHGLTPIPNVSVLEWTLDLACLRGYRLSYLFLLRSSNEEDYRPLLLFPRTIERVLIAMSPEVVPRSRAVDFHVVKIPKRPTVAVERALSIHSAIASYRAAFREVHGFEPPETKPQLIGTASRISSFWATNGTGLDFKEYCLWLLAERTRDGSRPLALFRNVIDREAVARFRTVRGRSKNEWIERGGWEALDRP